MSKASKNNKVQRDLKRLRRIVKEVRHMLPHDYLPEITVARDRNFKRYNIIMEYNVLKELVKNEWDENSFMNGLYRIQYFAEIDEFTDDQLLLMIWKRFDDDIINYYRNRTLPFPQGVIEMFLPTRYCNA